MVICLRAWMYEREALVGAFAHVSPSKKRKYHILGKISPKNLKIWIFQGLEHIQLGVFQIPKDLISG